MPKEVLRPESRVDTSASPTPDAIDGIRAGVSLRYTVMSKKRNQTVSVLVTDRNGDPRPDAKVEISFIESTSNTVLPGSNVSVNTDEKGFVMVSLPVNQGPSGAQIIVRAVVTYNGLTATAQNVFLLWW